MSAQQELLKNLMERAGVKKSRKRARDTVYQKESAYVTCPNTKMRLESSQGTYAYRRPAKVGRDRKFIRADIIHMGGGYVCGVYYTGSMPPHTAYLHGEGIRK